MTYGTKDTFDTKPLWRIPYSEIDKVDEAQK